MKSLLVPIDFSEQSIHAFRFALDIAKQSNGTVHMLHVISLPVLQESPLMPVPDLRRDLVEESRISAESKFNEIIREFNTRAIRIETHTAPGRIPATILDFIEKYKIDLVVMGTKGAAGIKEWMIGSNTEKIVRTSPVPLIAIKYYTPSPSFKNIVFPTTLDSENQEPLVMKIKALQDFFQATLHLIWVNTPALTTPDSEARKKLNAFAQRFMLKDFTINVFKYTNEEAGILEFTSQLNGDLIALGTRGLTGISHLLNGSIAEDVVNHVRFPVWTYCTKSANRLALPK
ncbi:MAG TPA: universal stress protein [Chryseosolibacter sp.]|nr:universal stress protein [Chryseosolibacter sp.]